MNMNIWRFVTLVVSALALAAPVAHALEMPVRLSYAPSLYVALTRTLYVYFAAIGSVLEVGAIACALTLCLLAWRDPWTRWRVRVWAIGGTACLLLAHLAFWAFVDPVDREFATWTAQSVPFDWTWFRDQWEWAHAARAALMVVGFCALVRSVVLDLPGRRGEMKRRRRSFRLASAPANALRVPGDYADRPVRAVVTE
jgi:hypothetical protein